MSPSEASLSSLSSSWRTRGNSGDGDDGVRGGTVESFHDSRRLRLIKRMFAAAQAQSSKKIKQRRRMTSRTGISPSVVFFDGDSRGARVGERVGDGEGHRGAVTTRQILFVFPYAAG